MSHEINYLETGSINPYYNLAFEEYILKNKIKGDYLLLWQNDNTVVVGRNQNTLSQINKAFVDEHQIKVVRRISGGGAVYHDLGNLNYSFITNVSDTNEDTAKRFIDPIVEALKNLTLDAQSSGRNDILVDGRKVSGTAECIRKDRILHHGTLLFDSDTLMISGALNADPLKFKDKSVKSVSSRVGNIKSLLKKDMSLYEFWSYLKKFLSSGGLKENRLTKDELYQINSLKISKYDTWEWNYGLSPKFDFINKRRFEAGNIEIGVHIGAGIIEDLRIYGDFMATTPLDRLEKNLKGIYFTKKDITKALDRSSLPIEEMLGGITKGQFIDTLLCS